jgi:hypothetical protein
MVTDQQVRRLWQQMELGKTLSEAALKAGLEQKTARKYNTAGELPSRCRKAHAWRTRPDPFREEWDDLQALLEAQPGLEAKTLLEELERRHPGKYSEGQLRTLQRRVKIWRASHGPGKEVFFEQHHYPGDLAASDFTDLSGYQVTIQGAAFPHLIYHFTLTYSNWEAGTLCFSESFESLSQGLQNALWRLGGVPQRHRTDCLTAAVHSLGQPEVFTRRYEELLGHYGLKPEKIQPRQAHENGDIEQRHHRLKRALEQALMLRGSQDFSSREEYQSFLEKLFEQQNAGRQGRLAEELPLLGPRPPRRLETYKAMKVRVRRGSTIQVQHNLYSVHSRLINEWVDLRLYGEHIEVWYAQQQVDTLPRLRGESKHSIQYRHIIDWLVRKPGAFANYRYREDLFPTLRFRIAYDLIREKHSAREASRQYLKILELAARESEARTDEALRRLIDEQQPIRAEAVEALLASPQWGKPPTQVQIDSIRLSDYDSLLAGEEVLG